MQALRFVKPFVILSLWVCLSQSELWINIHSVSQVIAEIYYFCRLRVPTKGNRWNVYGGKTKTTVSLPQECDLECSRHDLVLLKQVQIQGWLVNSTENVDSPTHCSRFFLVRDRVSQAERLVEVCALYLCKSCKRLIVHASSIAARPLQYRNVFFVSHIHCEFLQRSSWNFICVFWWIWLFCMYLRTCQWDAILFHCHSVAGIWLIFLI